MTVYVMSLTRFDNHLRHTTCIRSRSCCYRPEHARSERTLQLDLDNLHVAAAETSGGKKQDSPRTVMIRANLKKVSREHFHSRKSVPQHALHTLLL